jgi:cytosine/adenosine deaminase-related metal-dependent hydrolase
MSHDILIRGRYRPDDGRRPARAAGVDILIRDGVIAEIGPGLTAPGRDRRGAGCVVTPGLVNTHHHLYQTLTRAVPGAQDALLFGWLQDALPDLGAVRPDDMHVSALTGLAELALSGCTLRPRITSTSIPTARGWTTRSRRRRDRAAVSSHARAMSIGESAGGLPPDSAGRGRGRDPRRLHPRGRCLSRPRPGAMVRVGVAPCSPFSVSRDLMRDAAFWRATRA